MADTKWADLLSEEDVEGLWNGLYQLISGHAAVRPLHFAIDGAAVTSQIEINADLTQELFIELFQKRRFDHYKANRYTNSDIDNELAHIEIPNMVGARLRKRYPESFRMARRVSSLLKTSGRFRRFGEPEETGDAAQSAPRRRGRPPKAKKESQPDGELQKQTAPRPLSEADADLEALDELAEDLQEPGKLKRRRMVNQVFGLRSWPGSKAVRDSGHFSEMLKTVPMRRRDTRVVGRSGSSQLIISNPDLESLIVEVFEAIDSPADVRTIRQLVLAKIPLQDYNVASLDEELSAGSSGSVLRRDPSDTRATPEALLLREEQNRQTACLADEFLRSLKHAVNNNERRYQRLLHTLWHCYYNPQGPSQIEIARLLGISDSLVSDNRRLIEHELRKLKLTVEDGAIFSESLQRLITHTDSGSYHMAS